MPDYRRLGKKPPKRHIQMKRNPQDSFLGEGLCYEHVVTTEPLPRFVALIPLVQTTES